MLYMDQVKNLGIIPFSTKRTSCKPQHALPSSYFRGTMTVRISQPPKEACFGVQGCKLQVRNSLATGGAVALRGVDHAVISLVVIGYVELWNIKLTICSSFTWDYGFMLSYLSRVCKLWNFCHGLRGVSHTFSTVKIPIFIVSVNLLTTRFISHFVLASIWSITWKMLGNWIFLF